MNDATVRQVVRDKLAHGRLPRDRAGAIRATNGTNEICDVCSAAVSPEDVLYKVACEGSRGFGLHASCFAIWREERNSVSAGPGVLD